MTYGEELIRHIWPLALFLVMVGGLIVLMLTLPALLGGKRVSRAVNEPYECGIVPVGSTHFRMPIPFYLFAIFFVIFDLEVVFLFAWAVAVKETGWLGFTEALIFILILFAALIYLWRLGALDWRTSRQKLDLRNLDAR
ncbi:MAG: NAD(P)H-quinone oxidoreductase subunit 3 [Oceanospirillaceae bacterium]|jgi:NADH-quinone oxidoreductase subunit A|nr:NAD(P)H-quinone oxidoreductase subunit 3 [Oceanospirillaceae bacterium]MBT4442961.1 NAD(P)H-quinone oxidoreductase subunit 3 [Oceanospirillaceae bacterium]MBT6078324.1 NAD(P)H-quinone oxidoreductase subunit 3 [Oceanospirillaceae bacterium]MBT7331509.1 NAD(P)H-quinone oxidoreductase subunit 3 [Oceanospirillaceae bacterium]